MPHRDLVVVGASAGGVDALMRIVAQLPNDLAAAMLVVVHVSPNSPSNLPRVLGRLTPLPVAHARDGESIRDGRILVAPPDRHLIVRDGRVHLSRGPQENRHRPAVDVLFRTAALNRNGRTIGIVLSGALDDGAAGLRMIEAAGGTTIVQDPDDALVPSMPQSALEVVAVDYVLSADEIGRRLPDLLAEPPDNKELDGAQRDALEKEVAMNATAGDDGARARGDPSPFGCPDCGGVLFEADGKGGLRFRCRIGHAYTARALLAAEDAGVEEALWAALRALEEQESLSRRMSERIGRRGGGATVERLERRGEQMRTRADILRKFLLAPPNPDRAEDDLDPALAPAVGE